MKSAEIKREKNGFEKREELGDAYWRDPRWDEVKRLRKENNNLKANGLVDRIRSDWGL